MSLEGGSLIRPLFLDFTSKLYTSQLLELDAQFMVGLYIMVNPFLDPEIRNLVYFPSENFYDYYTGEYFNRMCRVL